MLSETLYTTNINQNHEPDFDCLQQLLVELELFCLGGVQRGLEW